MTPDERITIQANFAAGKQMSLADLEAIADRVVYLDWEPHFEAYGDGFLFSWEESGRSKYVTPRRFVGPYGDEKIVTNIMKSAALEGAGHVARREFRIAPAA